MFLEVGLLFIFLSLFFLIFGGILMQLFYNLNVMMMLLNVKFLDINIGMNFDWVSCMFSSVVFFISGLVMVYSKSYMSADKKKIKFFWLLFFFVLSMQILIFSSNIFMIMIGWDGLGMISYYLVSFYHNEESNSAAMITFLLNRLGDIGMILSFVFFIGSMVLEWGVCEYFTHTNSLCFMMIFAAMTKSAQIPFSAWLPKAMAAPTPVSSLVHSSTLVTAGVYLIIRFLPLLSQSMVMELLFHCSILTITISGLSSLFENDLKKIIALSTMSQLGVMMMILSLGEWNLSFFHLLSHALFKSTLFLSAGVSIHLFNSFQDIRLMGNLSSISPFLASLFSLSSLSLMGFPFLSGFYSKDLIMEFMYFKNFNLFYLLFIILSVSLTSIYSIRLIYYLSLEPVLKFNFISIHENSFFNFPIFFLSFFVIIFGASYFWIVLSPVIINISLFEKLLSLFLVFLSIIITLTHTNSSSEFHQSKNVNYFFENMWFLSPLTSFLLMKKYQNFSSVFILEKSLWEMFSSKSIFNELSSISVIWVNVVSLMFKMSLFLIFMVFLISF